MAEDANHGQRESLASREDATTPTAAKVALWLMVALVVVFALGIFISTIVIGDS